MSAELKTIANTLYQEQMHLSERQILDLASRLAACHPSLSGEARAVRSFLTIEASWRNLVDEIAGEPSRIVDFSAEAESSIQQTRLAGEAIAAIWEEDLLTSTEVARRLGAKPSNREKVNSLRRRSQLLGLPRDGGSRYLYPAFQIDMEHLTLRPEVREVNQLLEAESDPWGVASWWVSDNARLGSKPKDCIGTERSEAILEAARALIEPIG